LGEPRDWDKIVQPPCPDLASPRLPIPPASSLTSAANRPPCRGRQIPGTTIDPAALFRASFNPLLRPGKRDERKAHGALRWGENPAFKRPRKGGGLMSRARLQSVQALRPSQRQPPRAAPAKPLISRSFQAERQKAGDGHFGASSIKEDKPQKEHDLGITLGRGETHRICEAPCLCRGGKSLCGGTFMEI